MARQSAASLSVVASTSIDGRPKAPADLSERQREIWDRTVANEAADVFKTAALQQLLSDYCRHVSFGEKLARQIETEMQGDPDPDDLTKLMRLHDLQTKASSNLATKLRLTNQARYTPQAAATAAKKAGGESKVWQFGS